MGCLCKMRDDTAGPVLQNAKMDQPQFPNENYLGAWREKRGLTQAELAEKVGTTGSVISLLESGDRQLSPKWLRKLAPALDVPLGYLLEHHPDKIPDDVMEVWARVPSDRREEALRLLAVFAKTGTAG